MSSPEFCFFQMASQLSLVKLIELGFELCGTYAAPASAASAPSAPAAAVSAPASVAPAATPDIQDTLREVETTYNRSPLTTTKRLTAFVSKLGGVAGVKQASKALQYILDGSASPMETTITMLLTLPYRLGGYGLPAPELNMQITPAKTAKSMADRAFYSCDLYWPDFEIAVEYDSDAYHTGSARIASDSRRRNSLSALGVQVITITNQQVQRIEAFEVAAQILVVNMRRRMRFHKPTFKAKQQELRSLLL